MAHMSSHIGDGFGPSENNQYKRGYHTKEIKQHAVAVTSRAALLSKHAQA